MSSIAQSGNAGRTSQAENIGQPIDYSDDSTMKVPAISIDALAFTILDLLKTDVEGMEPEVLEGARDSIEKHRPIMVV